MDGDRDMKKLFLVVGISGLLAGCATERPLTSYDDVGLCTLKGQAMGYGNTEIIPKIQAELASRGKLNISQSDCETYIQTGKQDAHVRMQTSTNIIQQSQKTQMINAVQGY